MKLGERCALEGLLSVLKPELAIEIGTAQGGSLHRIAEHCAEVHSFDSAPEVAKLGEQFSNVEFHIGDSGRLLPELLDSLADRGRNVDFALVDGDHTSEGVQRDARALLEADSCRETVVVFHDAANDDVRAGIEALGLEKHPKVALALLDFVSGYLVENGPLRHEIWNGLALVVLDERRRGNEVIVDSEVYDAAALTRLVRDQLRSEDMEGEEAAAQAEDPGAQPEEPGALVPGAAATPADLELSGASADGIPERFIPDEMRGGMVAAEHLGRYWWAAQLAHGKRVLDAGCGIGYGSNMLAGSGAAEVAGVDIAEPIIEVARQSAAPGVTFSTGDVAALPFGSDSFDLVVCFEVIEHVEDTDAVLDELARVLAPGGVIVLSSPNRDRYVPGNPHHLYEFLPDELKAALQRRFAHVRLVRQHDWLASAILEDEVFAGSNADPIGGLEVRKLVGHEPGAETYTLALAGDGELPATLMPVTLTGTIELREWMDHYHEQDRILRQQAAHFEALKTLENERRMLRYRLEKAEGRVARMKDLEKELQDLELALADVPKDLERRLAGADQALRDVLSSPSWRITTPLRKLKRVARRGR